MNRRRPFRSQRGGLYGFPPQPTETEPLQLHPSFHHVDGRDPSPPSRAGQRRKQVIEIAIALLDAMDDDPDVEETGDLEPYLAWVGAGPGLSLPDDDRGDDDCEIRACPERMECRR